MYIDPGTGGQLFQNLAIAFAAASILIPGIFVVIAGVLVWKTIQKQKRINAEEDLDDVAQNQFDY